MCYREGYSYQEIADSLGYDCDYIKKVNKSNFQSLLRQYVIEHQLNIVKSATSEKAADSKIETTVDTKIDWGEASDVSIFYGRQSELDELESWIIQDKCRLIAILGMGGTGKTAVSIKLAQQILHHFDYVIWHSLRDSPMLSELLTGIIKFIDREESIKTLDSGNRYLSQLIKYLKKYRCLIVIDNFETVLQTHATDGTYRNGYQDYGEFIRRLGDVLHQSCILITSREKPEEIAALQGDKLPVRVCSLKGLDEVAGKKLLQAKGLKIADIDSKQLVKSYQGNALAIKIAATAIEDLFAGDITKFLAQETRVFNGLRLHLSRHFERLSDLELQIMCWLAINREPVSGKELQTDIVSSISSSQILETLEYLIRRSLVERTTTGFTQQPVIMEYVTEKIIETIAEEIISENINLFNTYALVKPQGKDYLKDSQIRIILEPLVEKLLIHFGSKQQLEKKLKQVLTLLRNLRFQKGYGAGNIVNIFRYLQTDLTGFDFSYLPIWQADLRNIQLHECNFSHVNFFSSVFAKVFSVVTSVTFSARGDYLATADTNGEVKIWSVQTGKCMQTLQGHDDNVWSVVFSPCQKMIASCSQDKTIKLWDLATGNCIKTFLGHQGAVTTVAFSVNASYLVSGSYDNTIKIWNIEADTCIQTIAGHDNVIMSLAIANFRIISSSWDETIKLWDLTTGNYLKTLRSDKLYEKMDITGISGLTEAQGINLKSLGALVSS